jgi:2-oxoglutarate ferredoxin oxidoreductase subunit alpha
VQNLDLVQGPDAVRIVYSVHSQRKETNSVDASLTSESLPRSAAPPSHSLSLDSVSIAIAGSGGSGVMTAGTWLLEAAARSGLYGLMVRTMGPQIRGGEAAALVRLATSQLESLDDTFDVMLAIDWQNVHRFADEIPLKEGGLLVCDADGGEIPEVFANTGARVLSLPLKKMAKAIPGSWINMLALGITGAMAGLPVAALEQAVRAGWTRGEEAMEANLRALREGVSAASGHAPQPRVALQQDAKRWLVSGNEGAGYGAIRGGIRFVAAYPITPATEVLEWLAPALTQAGGSLLQAEDELASINMIIGASFGGVPSLTATAGPGLSLMTEGLGLAVAAEVPIVVIDVMRGGPSTGIPAKSEQSDLSFAVGGLHGDAPRLVLAPSSISDCIRTTQWAVELAEALQSPALVLSDQFMGQSRAIVDVPHLPPPGAKRAVAAPNTPNYKRYGDTPNGVSPMAIPGTPGNTYTADGLEHTETGVPSSQAADHRRQLDKRLRKLMQHDYGSRWADVEGDAPLALITFGSAAGPVREAARRARAQGVDVRVIVLRLVAPIQPQAMALALEGVERVMVVEQNHEGQLLRYLKGVARLPGDPAGFHRPGPLPLRPADICAALVEWAAAKEETK